MVPGQNYVFISALSVNSASVLNMNNALTLVINKKLRPWLGTWREPRLPLSTQQKEKEKRKKEKNMDHGLALASDVKYGLALALDIDNAIALASCDPFW